MKFWDSSALIPLIVEEVQTPRVVALAREDEELWVWWGTLLECRAAIARRLRDGSLAMDQRQLALENLSELAQNWHEIQPSESVREVASRLVSTHPLRAADSLQLAAAIVASQGKPQQDHFISFDQRLAHAAILEGYHVVNS